MTKTQIEKVAKKLRKEMSAPYIFIAKEDGGEVFTSGSTMDGVTLINFFEALVERPIAIAAENGALKDVVDFFKKVLDKKAAKYKPADVNETFKSRQAELIKAFGKLK